MSDYPAEDELALMLVIPHTTAVRGNRWEFTCTKSFLKSGVFHLQQIQLVSEPPTGPTDSQQKITKETKIVLSAD